MDRLLIAARASTSGMSSAANVVSRHIEFFVCSFMTLCDRNALFGHHGIFQVAVQYKPVQIVACSSLMIRFVNQVFEFLNFERDNHEKTKQVTRP
jgi:hypothetical protein